MPIFHSFLQAVKKMHQKERRHGAGLSMAALTVFVITLAISGIGEGVEGAIPAYAETLSYEEASSETKSAGELKQITEEKIEEDPVSLNPKQKEKVEQMLRQTREGIQGQYAKGSQVLADHVKKESQKKQKRVIDYSEEDYEVLLKIVQAEAGICDEKGKILVANVIINRVKSDEFPDTVKKVVYQPSQFSPVSNGSINRVKVTQETIDCVNRALEGEDYSQGALYFMYRNGSRGSAVRWFDRNLDFLFRHEKHEFFK